MVIFTGKTIAAEDHEKNIITYLESVSQGTTISENTGTTDKTYQFAKSDIFTDATGFNDTVASTSGVSFDAGLNGFILPLVLYDDFNDNSIDGGLWTNAGSGSVIEANQRIEMLGNSSVPSNTTGDNNESVDLTSTTNFVILKFTVIKLLFTQGGGGFGITERSEHLESVEIGGTVIVDRYGNSGSAGTPLWSAVYNDLDLGEWTLLKTGIDEWSLFKDAAFLRTFNGLSGTVRFFNGVRSRGEPADAQGVNNTGEFDFDNVFLDIDSAGTVTLEPKTIIGNVGSILVCAENAGGDTLDFDISTDGGSVFEKQNQPTDTVIELDGDNTDVVVKFNLNAANPGITPIFKGYAWQVWTV